MELYNLADDLSEKTDLAAANPTKAAALRAKLVAWRTAVGAQSPTKNPAFDAARAWDGDGAAAAKKGAGKGKKQQE